MKLSLKLLIILSFILMGISFVTLNADAHQPPGGPSPYASSEKEDYFLIGNYIHEVNPGIPDSKRKQIAAAIVKYANQFHQDPIWIASAIKAESTFNSDCGGPQKGLFQIDPGVFATAKAELRMPKDATIWDVEWNIQAGCHYLDYQKQKVIRELGKSVNNDREALLAYNCGFGGAVSRGWEDNFHVRKVLNNKEAILNSRDY